MSSPTLLSSYLVIRAGTFGWFERFWSVATYEQAESNLKALAQARALLLASGVIIDGGRITDPARRGSVKLVDMSGIQQPPRGLGKDTWQSKAGFVWDSALCRMSSNGGPGFEGYFYGRSMLLRALSQTAWTGNPGTQVQWQELIKLRLHAYMNFLCAQPFATPGTQPGQLGLDPKNIITTPYGQLAQFKLEPRYRITRVDISSITPPRTTLTAPGAGVTIGQKIRIHGFQRGYKILNGYYTAQVGSGANTVVIAKLPHRRPGVLIKAVVQKQHLVFAPFQSGVLLFLRKHNTRNYLFRVSWQLRNPALRFIDTCGTVMDWSRSGKLSKFQLFSDVDALTPAFWYGALPGAKLFPDWHVFANSDFFPDDLRHMPGDFNNVPRTFAMPTPPAPLTGQHYCGPLSAYQGLTLSTSPPPVLELGAIGQCLCCLPDQDDMQVDVGAGTGVDAESGPDEPGFFEDDSSEDAATW